MKLALVVVLSLLAVACGPRRLSREELERRQQRENWIASLPCHDQCQMRGSDCIDSVLAWRSDANARLRMAAAFRNTGDALAKNNAGARAQMSDEMYAANSAQLYMQQCTAKQQACFSVCAMRAMSPPPVEPAQSMAPRASPSTELQSHPPSP